MGWGGWGGESSPSPSSVSSAVPPQTSLLQLEDGRGDAFTHTNVRG